MSVSEVSSSTGSYQTSSPQTNFRQLFQKLGQSLQAGNLSDAQQAYDALTQTTSNSSQTVQGQLSQDFNTLGDALQSGNLTSAQEAFLKLQQDLQGAGHAHRHHHRHQNGTGDSQSATANTTNAAISNGDDNSQSSGKTIDVTT